MAMRVYALLPTYPAGTRDTMPLPEAKPGFGEAVFPRSCTTAATIFSYSASPAIGVATKITSTTTTSTIQLLVLQPHQPQKSLLPDVVALAALVHL